MLCEPDSDFLRGWEALFQYIKSNKNSLTPEQVNDFDSAIFSKMGPAREAGLELHQWQHQKFVCEYLGIELSVSSAAAEKILWDNVSAGAVMPNADEIIDYINANGIRSGVISNASFSEVALTERVNRLLPRNKFEFIIASSEYMFRKPNPMLFELALKKAGLSAEDVWYCGDSIKADIEGSAAIGIFPVWYEDETMENPWRGQNAPKGVLPQCEHLHIQDWNELISVLEGLK